MNPTKSIWSDKPMETGIAALVCYAGVFNDVIGVEEMASRLGVKASGSRDEFDLALGALHRQDRIVVKDGFAGLPGFEDKIAIKPEKIAFTKKLIASRMKDLRRIGRNPLIKFVGISGSLAADNPTRDKNGCLDLDVFLITRKRCLWIYRIILGVRNVFSRDLDEPELCINYIMDESDLMVSNRNFYTATEIRNLVPVVGMDTYWRFLWANAWTGCFYPGMRGAGETIPCGSSGKLANKVFFFFFIVLRCIKWFSSRPLREVVFTSDIHSGESACTAKAPCGGYHALVQKKFSRLADVWYADLLDGALMEDLFPDDLSVEIRSNKLDIAAIAQAAIGDAYGKYG